MAAAKERALIDGTSAASVLVLSSEACCSCSCSSPLDGHLD